MKRLLILLFIPFLIAAAPTKNYTFISSTTIRSAEVNEDFDDLYGYLQTGVDTLRSNAIDSVGELSDDLCSDNQVLKKTSGSWACGTDATGSGGSAITLDIEDDGGDDSVDLTEIATNGDTNSIFTEPSADKLYIDLSKNWPTADAATTATTASTATALAANGGNCSSGQAPLGVDASGAVESCFDVWTEAENTSAGYISATLTEEEVEDYVGGMLGGTETNISVTYQDATNDIDFVVSDAFLINSGNDTSTGGLTVTGVIVTTDIQARNLISCDTIDTDASGTLKCGTDSEGAGGGDLKADGTVPLTANWDVGNYDITLKALTGDGTIEGATLTEGGNAVYNSSETPGGELGGTWASPTIDDSISVSSWTLAGATMTGTIDAGGADDLEMPNGAAPTVDTEGQFAWDTTKGQLLIYSGSTVQVFYPPMSRCAFYENLISTDDNMSLGALHEAVTITGIGCTYVGTGTTVASISLEDGGNNDMTHTSPVCTANGTDFVYAPVTASNTLGIGELLRFDVDNTPDPVTDDYTICYTYKWTRQ